MAQITEFSSQEGIVIPQHKKLEKKDDIEGIEVENWVITTKSTKILSSEAIEEITQKHNLRGIPEMIFGNNFVKLEFKINEKDSIFFKFDAVSALKTVDNSSAKDIKVKHSAKWQKNFQSKGSENSEIKLSTIPEYDWTFTPYYTGDISRSNNSEAVKIEETSEKFNMTLLQREDPMLFYSTMIFFDDDLGDNGISQLSLKMRVMPTCIFLLLRFWLRIDGVLFRIHDIRLFHQYKSNFVLRELQVKESPWNSIVGQLGNSHSKYTNPDVVAPLLKTKKKNMVKISLE